MPSDHDNDMSCQLARAVLVAGQEIPGKSVVQSLVFLLDRALDQSTSFDHHLYGPYSPEINGEIERWIWAGQAEMIVTHNMLTPDPVEGAHVLLRLLPVDDPRFAIRVEEFLVVAARRLLVTARDQHALTPSAAAAAAKIVLALEYAVPAWAGQPFEEYVADFRWARIDPEDYKRGIAFARALGYHET
jgi:hypothetical protein